MITAAEEIKEMDDLISRKAAIDGFYEMASDTDHLCTVSDYVSFLETLPSEESECTIETQDAVTGTVGRRAE